MTLARLTHADEVAAAFDISRPWGLGGGQGVYGWQFIANSEIQVLTVGIYDNPGIYGGGFVGDGLVEPHIVSIWDVSEHASPLVSAATHLGAADPQLNGFRYVRVSPVVLRPGREYVIAATYPNNDIPINPNKDLTAGSFGDSSFVLTLGEGLTFGGYRSVADSSGLPVFPDYYFPGDLYAFGPNFTYMVVPEPSSFALWGIGAGVLWGITRPQRSRRPIRG
jgi:hypothetical protein